MKPFEFLVPDSPQAAVAAVSDRQDASFLAGGTNLVDHLKLGVASPGLLVDVTGLTSSEISQTADGSLRIGAAVRNSELAADRHVRQSYPALSQALLSGASGQLRNMATTGGNPLQRTRCVYFQDVTTPCNKRVPGSGCSAIGGATRGHAILGTSEACIAMHPSDMAVALAAFDARVQILSLHGDREMQFTELHKLAGDDPERDTVLEHGELITAIDVPALSWAKHSAYRKVRDRASYAFALVSVAAALDVVDGAIRDVRLAFGGVAHKPWRAYRAEESLRGGPLSDAAFRTAADAELADARPQQGIDGGNAFKLTLLARTIVAVLRELSAKQATS
jgi:xanthine dehydrogenase YagS FAD-binding subunit